VELVVTTEKDGSRSTGRSGDNFVYLAIEAEIEDEEAL
jgi:hypothetical protein